MLTRAQVLIPRKLERAHALQSGYTRTREVSLFSWSTCSKGNAVHEFPLGDASSDVIVTCPINSPVGSRPLKTLQPSAPLARPSVAFYERETVSRESPSSFIASLPHEHTRVTPPPHRDIVLFRHSSSLSFARRREKEVL